MMTIGSLRRALRRPVLPCQSLLYLASQASVSPCASPAKCTVTVRAPSLRPKGSRGKGDA